MINVSVSCTDLVRGTTPELLGIDARIDARDDLVRALRNEREPVGAVSSDHELVLAAYRAWGDSAPERIIGDFAFVIRDPKRRRVIAARDPFGVRPLFYTTDGETISFASSVKMLDHGNAVDDDALARFLIGGISELPETTAVAGVRRTRPGHVLTWRGGDPSHERYWSLPTGEAIQYRNPRDYIEHFRDVFDRAVRDRMRGDVVATLMSGGLSSTAVAATARMSRASVEAFTMTFRTLMRDEEEHYARLAADFAGLDLHVVARDRYRLFDKWDEINARRGEPNDDPLAASFVDAARNAAKYASVMLTGYGGDAAFCASSTLVRRLLLRVRPPREQVPAWIVRRELEAAEVEGEPPHPRRAEAQRRLTDPRWTLMFESWHRSQTGVPIDLVHPYFDRRVVELLMAIPPVPWFTDRQLLRESMRGRLPEEVRLRAKTPLPHDPIAILVSRSVEELAAVVRGEPEMQRYVNTSLWSKELSRGVARSVLPVCAARWLRDRALPSSRA
jgi:asparagine synthase (glutamine-hydrolysing)